MSWFSTNVFTLNIFLFDECRKRSSRTTSECIFFVDQEKRRYMSSVKQPFTVWTYRFEWNRVHWMRDSRWRRALKLNSSQFFSLSGFHTWASNKLFSIEKMKIHQISPLSSDLRQRSSLPFWESPLLGARAARREHREFHRDRASIVSIVFWYRNVHRCLVHDAYSSQVWNMKPATTELVRKLKSALWICGFNSQRWKVLE